MGTYYLNLDTSSNPNGDNEVHESSCRRMPSAENRVYLGVFSDCIQAVQAAKLKGYSKADGCKICSPEAHHS